MSNWILNHYRMDIFGGGEIYIDRELNLEFNHNDRHFHTETVVRLTVEEAQELAEKLQYFAGRIHDK